MTNKYCSLCVGNKKCLKCKGRGYFSIPIAVTCRECGGTGKCKKCSGTGRG